jgi:selenocysteine-specific elongation factor
LRVIGTAGHVDHGKSTLIEALTGTHPDRLQEEQAREMTIDLGFGWLRLPDGREIGIIDVPGHRDFVENMLAGVAGIDAALLVVAMDEGVMPQTKEHLAIIDLLQIPGGVIALTKTDLIQENDWSDAIEADVRSAVAGTILQAAPIVRVSARTGTGLDELLSTLSTNLARQPDRADLARPRLAIDRVFSMEGFGTVVTGTLVDGQLAIGDDVQLLPSGRRGRVRGIQTHRKQVARALPGSRTAVNIAGIATDELHRGEVLIHPGQYRMTRRLDARFRVLTDASSGMAHNREVKVFVGTSSRMATLRLLGTDDLPPGQEGWIQLELHEPVVCARGDAFILRRPSPAETLGGGNIVEPHPAGRHKRFATQVIASLEALREGNAEQVLHEAARALPGASMRQVVERSRLMPEEAKDALKQLLASGNLIQLEGGQPAADSEDLVMSLGDWNTLEEKLDRVLTDYHRRFPMRVGIPREELKSQLEITPKLFNSAIRRKLADGGLNEKGPWISKATHEIRFGAAQQAIIDNLLERFRTNPYSPPTAKECREFAGEEIVGALVAQGELVSVSQDVLFRKADYDLMVAGVREAIESKGRISLAEVRDLFHTSRRYAQALLEHLDSIGVTKRVGEYRTLSG